MLLLLPFYYPRSIYIALWEKKTFPMGHIDLDKVEFYTFRTVVKIIIHYVYRIGHLKQFIMKICICGQYPGRPVLI